MSQQNNDAQPTPQLATYDAVLLAFRRRMQEKYPEYKFKFAADAKATATIDPVLMEFETGLQEITDKFTQENPGWKYKFTASIKAPPKGKVLNRVKHTSDDTAIYHAE
jgi:hypothetical protein